MSKRRFSQEEVAILSKNENVKKCGEKSITYAKDFKIKAVKRYAEGISSRDIFREAGFDFRMIGKHTPKDRLKAWNKTYRQKGESALGTEARGKGGGRPKKIKDASDTDKIKRLETEVACLKAENDFLIKLRAKRAERYSSRNSGTGLSKI
jgi:hypothetical protein